jgi:hypothetical protein
VAAKDSSHDAASSRARTPIRAAAVLLGIYIAMYLAVAGIIHVLTSPDAAVACTGRLDAPSAAGPHRPPRGRGRIARCRSAKYRLGRAARAVQASEVD